MGYVSPDDIKECAYDVLRHRIILSYEAEAEEVKSDDVITQIINKIKVRNEVKGPADDFKRYPEKNQENRDNGKTPCEHRTSENTCHHSRAAA